jgi:uroporphyrinogen-III decarboxylase
VVQPEAPPLFEDFNVPRSVRPPVVDASDLPKLRYLLCPPSTAQLASYRERMGRIRGFAREKGVLVCGWSLFGLDAVVWLCGVEGAVTLAQQEPETFGELVELVDAFDRMRTELMLEVGGVDLVVQRGWYGSVDFWSPRLFERYVVPNLKRDVRTAHGAGARFAYVMTSGVKPLLRYLVEAGVDLFYWADPVQGGTDLDSIHEELGNKVAIAGGVNAPLTLGNGSFSEIREAVRSALETLGPAGFILEPVDSLFPDTPWPAVECMIDAWREMVF